MLTLQSAQSATGFPIESQPFNAASFSDGGICTHCGFLATFSEALAVEGDNFLLQTGKTHLGDDASGDEAVGLNQGRLGMALE